MRKQPTEEQRAKAAERREKFRQLVKQVAAMSDVERMGIVEKVGAVVTCEGRPLSVHNTILLFHQLENVSMVGGFQQWIKAGRCVRKGQHGLSIWIPCKGSSEPKAGSEFLAEVANDQPERPRFIMGTVFDISQTDEIAKEEAA